MKVETVKIESDSGIIIINKSDYDPEKHTLAGEKKDHVKKTVKKAVRKPKAE